MKLPVPPDYSLDTVDFAGGFTKASQLPPDGLPHIGFLGRSNAGKSSVLNALTGKQIARVSSTPGKTQEVNLFLCNQSFYFGDMPGIGFAKVSHGTRSRMEATIRDYVEGTTALRGIVYLTDIRTGGNPLDVEHVDILRSLGKPVLLVATKVDKCNQSELVQGKRRLMASFHQAEPPVLVSSMKGTGITQLWEQILHALSQEI